MYEIGLRLINGVDKITTVYREGRWLFNVYKGLNQMTDKDYDMVSGMQPGTAYAKLEDVHDDDRARSKIPARNQTKD